MHGSLGEMKAAVPDDKGSFRNTIRPDAVAECDYLDILAGREYRAFDDTGIIVVLVPV
jgi:hypothetical protein